ncbi:MAG: hypothetical protein ACTHK7_20900 [Aureliella sp.]
MLMARDVVGYFGEQTMPSFHKATKSFSIAAKFSEVSKAPLGEVEVIIGDKPFFLWPKGYQFFHYPVVRMFAHLTKLASRRVSIDVDRLSESEFISVATDERRLASTECLDGATRYVIGTESQIALLSEFWPSWRDNGSLGLKWQCACAAREELEEVVGAYVARVNEMIAAIG